jgi:phosphoglycerol transferase MdoB-like AlkP superfamily enzyme
MKYFPHAGIGDFLWGIMFDVCSITMFFSPFILVSLCYFFLARFRFYHILNNFLFHISNITCISLNALDFEFFKFTSKRSTFDFFTMMSYGNDAQNLIPSMIKKYWVVVLASLVIIGASIWLYNRTRKLQKQLSVPIWWKGSLFFVLMGCVFFMTARMSFGVKPLNLNHASNFASPENIPLVLNTPFSMIKTINETRLPYEEYYSPAELESLYNPVQSFAGNDSLETKPNVVIIIMESMSREFSGKLTGKKTYTPFLDSLMGQSLLFTQAFANGKRSIEATPTITASLPSFMESPYISSAYSNDVLKGLGELLKGMGYSTTFFHGASNGSMNFDSYATAHGFEHYYGRKEFGNDEYYDGTWGIFDEEFFQYWISVLDKEKQPFFCTHFTLTAHSPYPLPEKYKNVYTSGPTPMHNSQRYADFALKRFFKAASTKPWFANTLFVLVADHTSDSNEEEYENSYGRYRIPLFMYNKNMGLKGVNTQVVQQSDIMPTVLDLVGYKGKAVCFGTSVFKKGYRFALQYVNGVYQMVDSNYVVQFNGHELMSMYQRQQDPLLKTNILDKEPALAAEKLKYLKAFLQQYFGRIQFNKLTVNE